MASNRRPWVRGLDPPPISILTPFLGYIIQRAKEGWSAGTLATDLNETLRGKPIQKITTARIYTFCMHHSIPLLGNKAGAIRQKSGPKRDYDKYPEELRKEIVEYWLAKENRSLYEVIIYIDRTKGIRLKTSQIMRWSRQQGRSKRGPQPQRAHIKQARYALAAEALFTRIAALPEPHRTKAARLRAHIDKHLNPAPLTPVEVEAGIKLRKLSKSMIEAAEMELDSHEFRAKRDQAEGK